MDAGFVEDDGVSVVVLVEGFCVEVDAGFCVEEDAGLSVVDDEVSVVVLVSGFCVEEDACVCVEDTSESSVVTVEGSSVVMESSEDVSEISSVEVSEKMFSVSVFASLFSDVLITDDSDSVPDTSGGSVSPHAATLTHITASRRRAISFFM